MGIGRNTFHFTSLRGVPLQDIELIFTHENVNFAGCDSIQGGPCAKMGIPNLENDIMQFEGPVTEYSHGTSRTPAMEYAKVTHTDSSAPPKIATLRLACEALDLRARNGRGTHPPEFDPHEPYPNRYLLN